MANANVSTLIFQGSIAGSASIQAQGIAGNLTFQLPNVPPVQGQLMTAQAINGTSVVLGWSSAQSLSNIPLTALSITGASSGDVIQFNGTNWAVSAFVPGSGTVTSVALAAPAEFSVSGSPITGAGTLTLTKANQSANTVWAGPTSGGAAAPAFRALVVADIPALPYDASGAAAAVAAQLPSTQAGVLHQFLKSYAAGTPGTFTTAQPDFTDLSGSLTIAQINSKQGNGNAVQLTNTGATVSGHVVTYDANSNVQDSGTALSSLATTASLSAYAQLAGADFTGPVSITFGGAGLIVNAELNMGNNQTLLMGTNGHLDMSSSSLNDGTSSPGTSGQLLSSTVTGVAWIDQSTLAIAASQITTGQLALARGGTHADLSATGGASQVLRQSGVGADITVSQLGVTDVSGAAPLASPTFTGIVSATHVQATSGSDLLIDALSTNGVRIADNGNARGVLVGGSAGAGHIWLWSPAGSALVDVSDADTTISGSLKLNNSLIVPASGQDVAGTVTLTAETSHAVVFNAAFTGTQAPVVVVTALNADPSAAGGVWITNQGTSGNWTGFTVNVTTSSTATFNYVVIGS